MEEKIEPCSQEDHRKFLQEFEKQGCDYKCRTEQLEKLAENFERKKDSLYLRALLCANKDSASDRYEVRNEIKYKQTYYRDEDYYWTKPPASQFTLFAINTKVSFFDKALAHKNIGFLKVFFGLYSREGAMAITFADPDEYPFSHRSLVAEPDFGIFNQMQAIKDEGVAELMFTHIKRSVSLPVILRCNVLPFFAPGCKFVLKKYQQDKEAALQEAAKLEQKKQAWKQELREVGK